MVDIVVIITIGVLLGVGLLYLLYFKVVIENDIGSSCSEEIYNETVDKLHNYILREAISRNEKGVLFNKGSNNIYVSTDISGEHTLIELLSTKLRECDNAAFTIYAFTPLPLTEKSPIWYMYKDDFDRAYKKYTKEKIKKNAM